MSRIQKNSRGEYGGASLIINTTDDAADDNGIAITNAGMPAAGSPINVLEFDAQDMLSLELYAWAETVALDVEIRRLEGYSADGSEVWGEFVAEATLTAASNADDVQEAEISQLYSGVIRAGRYAVFCNLNTGTTDGRLHLYGVLKG